MKKTQKALLLILCVALCAVMVSCGTGGKVPADGLGVPTFAVGEWATYYDSTSDGGSCTAELTSVEEVIDGVTVTTHTVVGNVTAKFQYGYAGWTCNPDEATLALLKTAKGFSFKILGDGKRYTFKYKTSDITDHAYFEYSFNTEPGEVLTIEIPLGFLMQASWGIPRRLNMANVFAIEWQTHESWRRDPEVNPFEIKIWDFYVYN